MAGADRELAEAVAALSASAMRRHGRTFFLASLLLGPRRQGVEALYRVCRHIDDIADEPCADGGGGDPASRRAALDALDAALGEGRGEAPCARVVLRLRDRCGLPVAAVRRLIAAAREDLQPQRPRDFDDLLRYAFGVAGVVGLALCPLLGTRDPHAQAPAVALGVGMQLTNIARDVVADARIDRIYLPEAWAPSLCVSRLAAADPVALAQAHAAACRLLDEADAFYALAEAGMGFLPLRSRGAVRAAARMYRGIGAEVRALGADGAVRRAVVGRGRKTVLLLGLVFSRRPRFARPAPASLPAVLRAEIVQLGAVQSEVAQSEPAQSGAAKPEAA
jgi:phytoene synthase